MKFDSSERWISAVEKKKINVFMIISIKVRGIRAK